jgi:ABC-type sugar transport system substrate-binding protein
MNSMLGGVLPLIILAHGANAACLGGCPARDALYPLRFRFVTHGAQADGFWQAMQANAVGAASTFGADFDPVADWVWYESDAAQAATIRSHADTSVALVVTAQSEEVATAVRDAAEAGVRVLGINSGLTLLRAAGAALSAYIGTDDRLRGVKAAEHMLAAGVSNPVSGSVTQPCIGS